MRLRYKVEVIADDSGKWCSNALRFDDPDAAQAYAKDLYSRWTAVREWRVVPLDQGERSGFGQPLQEVDHEPCRQGR